jgi:hypothetical protein
MSSCNEIPVILAINPSKTVGCEFMISCNGPNSNLGVSGLFSTGSGAMTSCNGDIFFDDFLRE